MKNNLTVAIALLLLSSGSAFAQEKIGARYDKAMENQHVKFGIKAGPSLANLTVDNAGTVNDKKAIPAYHVGVYIDVPLLPVFSIQGGLQLGMKGSKFTIGDESSTTYTKVSQRPLYLELPLNAVVKIPLVNKVKLFVGAGPYIAMGVGGKTTSEGKFLGVAYSNESSITYSNKNNSTGYNGDLKRYDAGLNFLAGLEISKFTLNVNYGYGLSNIKSGSDNNNMKYANRVASLSVGLLF
ncbi:MAG: porin family protein [Chitinophagaceae bacterium]